MTRISATTRPVALTSRGGLRALATTASLALTAPTFAASSASYNQPAGDTTGGGGASTSASYANQGVVAQTASGLASFSTAYLQRPGLLAMAERVIAVAPAAPSVSRLIPNGTSIRIAFYAPAFDGGLPISAYQASCTGGGHTYTSNIELASPLTVSGLTLGVAYTCGVYAINSIGSSSESATVTKVAKLANSIVPLLSIILD